MKLFPMLVILVFHFLSSSTFAAEEKKEKDSYFEALKTFDSKGFTLKVYTDLFTPTPIKIALDAAYPEFYVTFPTDVPREFANVEVKMNWEGDKLRVLVRILKEVVYTMSDGNEESRQLGIQNLALILKPDQTVVPVEMNGKVLKVSLVKTPE